MKKFEINFYNTWYGFNHLDLFTYDIFKAKTGIFIELTILNFELDVTYRTDKQLKEQKKWNKEMDMRAKEWQKELDNYVIPKKKVAKVAAKKRKTTK